MLIWFSYFFPRTYNIPTRLSFQFVCIVSTGKEDIKGKHNTFDLLRMRYSLFFCLFDVNYRALVFFLCFFFFFLFWERVIYTFVSRLHTTKMTNEVVAALRSSYLSTTLSTVSAHGTTSLAGWIVMIGLVYDYNSTLFFFTLLLLLLFLYFLKCDPLSTLSYVFIVWLMIGENWLLFGLVWFFFYLLVCCVRLRIFLKFHFSRSSHLTCSKNRK